MIETALIVNGPRKGITVAIRHDAEFWDVAVPRGEEFYKVAYRVFPILSPNRYWPLGYALALPETKPSEACALWRERRPTSEEE